MAKFYGAIGFAKSVEIAPGIYEDQITERFYSGDLIRNTRSLQPSDSVNNNINISNEISIVSDPFANQHMFDMRYVVFEGAKWKISNVEVQHPRLRLTIGGLYNGR